MRSIWKFEIHILNSMVSMPKGAEIFYVESQGAHICLWAFIDTETEQEVTRHFRVVGTGHPLPDDIRKDYYVGSVMQTPYVWHIFVFPEGVEPNGM